MLTFLDVLWQVQPKHVKEAFRLLSKSIIRVEQPDVHLEEDAEEQQHMEVDGEKILSNIAVKFQPT